MPKLGCFACRHRFGMPSLLVWFPCLSGSIPASMDAISRTLTACVPEPSEGCVVAPSVPRYAPMGRPAGTACSGMNGRRAREAPQRDRLAEWAKRRPPCRPTTRGHAYAMRPCPHPARELNLLRRRKTRPPGREHNVPRIVRGEFIIAPVTGTSGWATCLAGADCLLFSFDLGHEHVAAGIAWPLPDEPHPNGRASHSITLRQHDTGQQTGTAAIIGAK